MAALPSLMVLLTGCFCRNTRSSRRSLCEKPAIPVGDVCKGQSTAELWGTSGFDSSGSFSIFLNYEHPPFTVWELFLHTAILFKTTTNVCVYHCQKLSRLQKAIVKSRSNKISHWLIQISRSFLLQLMSLVSF